MAHANARCLAAVQNGDHVEVNACCHSVAPCPSLGSNRWGLAASGSLATIRLPNGVSDNRRRRCVLTMSGRS